MFLCFQIYQIRSGLSAAQKNNFQIVLFDLMFKENVDIAKTIVIKDQKINFNRRQILN